MKFNALINHFMLDCKSRKLSPRTLVSYKNNLLRFNHWIGDNSDIEDINSLIIKEYMGWLVERECKSTYINTQYKTLKAFYTYLIEEEIVDSCPLDKIRKIKEVKPLITTFTNDEVKAMLKVTNGNDFYHLRDKLIITLLADTGIRCLELCTLKVDNIFDDFLLINGKGGKDRVVPITPSVLRCLNKYQKARAKRNIIDNDYLLTSRSGRLMTVSAIEHNIKRIGKEAGVRNNIRCSPHTFRHYFAQSNLLGGNDIYTISKLLGHSNIGITQTYINSITTEDILRRGCEYSPLSAIK